MVSFSQWHPATSKQHAPELAKVALAFQILVHEDESPVVYTILSVRLLNVNVFYIILNKNCTIFFSFITLKSLHELPCPS